MVAPVGGPGGSRLPVPAAKHAPALGHATASSDQVAGGTATAVQVRPPVVERSTAAAVVAEGSAAS